MVAVDAACFFLYRSHGKGSRLQDRVHRRSNGQSVIGMIWCVGVVGESGGPVREYSFVAYLIPTFGCTAINWMRRNHLTSRSSFLLQSSRAQLIPAMPKAADQLRSCSCLEAGHQEQSRCIEMLLDMQDIELLFFYVESLNPGASESVIHSVLNACLLRLTFFVT